MNYPNEIWADTDLVCDDHSHEGWQRYKKVDEPETPHKRMKFIDKIRILEQDPKFQDARRKLKAMVYIASRNPSTSLTLSRSNVLTEHRSQPGHLVGVYGWVLNLGSPKKQYSIETLSMIPLSEHNFGEV